jgi:SAM-dependent methyltransferase
MNYGYRPPPGAALLGLAPEEEADRSSIELYRLVAGAVDLTDRDVLEVGSGRGGGAAFISRHLRPRTMVGLDIAPRAVAFCRVRHAEPGLSFESGDAENLPFVAGSFDVVLNIESSHCYGELHGFLREVRRVLRPTGYLLYADFRLCAELETWRKQLLGAGFTLVEERDITAGVVAALESDDDSKRRRIHALVERPLAWAFRQFAALRGTFRYEQLSGGTLAYRAFVLRRSAAP